MKATKVLLGPLVLLLVTIWAVLYMSVDPRSLRSFSETHYRDNRGDFFDKRDDRPSLLVQRKNAKTRSGKNMAVTDHNLLESTHEATNSNDVNDFSETLGLKTLEKPGTSRNLFGDEAASSTASIKPSKTEQVVNMAAIFPTTPPPKKEAHTKIFQQNVAKKFVELPSGDTHADSHNLALSERSVCPWSYYIDHDPNRIPHDIAQAKCRCTACLDPVTNKQNYNYACVPVTIKKLVLRRKKKKSGGYRYRDEWQDVAVGCTCVQPRYSP
ncbi:IL17B [Branchiostoma lanceolatum]|uniref:IL17B protein n=1 Tax=Branchiostoma lanceolatum TaxID=7740 RepID=A0A8K0ELR0_BRALA|nr:IL17B [Branchiostoma lanceolatum]